MFTIEDLFYVADVDDISDEDGAVDLVFTMRGGDRAVIQITGSDLADALEQAETEVRRHDVMRGLRNEGLTDADIDRLAAVDPSGLDEAWERGYVAGATDSSRFLTEHALSLPPPAFSAPAEPAAAEPFDSLSKILAAPGALEALTTGDGIGITLALIHPAKIVLA